MKLKIVLLLAGSFALLSTRPLALSANSSLNSDAARAEAKLQHIEKNSELAHPDGTPTEFTDAEINAYFTAGKVQMPAEVQSVAFRAQPGVVTAYCRVNFDEIEAGHQSNNPLLSLFSGIHDVVVAANARGAGGQGVVEVQSGALDGVEIPRFVLELFVEKYLTPKYPNVGLESRFRLPDKIETAVVGDHKLTVIQK